MTESLRRLETADPTDLDGLAHLLADADPEGRLQPIGMHAVEIGSDALLALPDAVADLTTGDSVTLLVDRTPMARGDADLKETAHELLASRFAVRHTVLGPPDQELHADEEVVDQATAAIAGADAVVVVGSGTITDVAKAATVGDPRPPLIAVQTAASVNGFADDRSVLLLSGAKRTVTTRWPDVLLVDLEVLASAPTEMNLAGLGDLLAVFTAPTDWYLAMLLGLDDAYHPAPAALYRDRTRRLVGDADKISVAEPGALDELARLLTLSGVAMGVAGTTAPSSGAEHVVSHLVDMARGQAGTPLALHGAQVGVATVPMALAWSVLLEEFAVSDLDPATLFPAPEEMETTVRTAFAGMDPSGRVGEACWQDFRRKLSSWHANRERVRATLENWDTHRSALAELVAPGEQLAAALTAAGAPTQFSQLRPPVEPELARWAITDSRLMRNRFNVTDLLAFAGWWTDELIEALLRRTESVGGGL